MYRLTEEDKDNVKKYGYKWDEPNLQYLKNKIRDHLIRDTKYGGYCYYCKWPIGTGTTPGDIEHIVHKSEYKLFAYEPMNLTLACDRCNTAKSKKDVLVTSLSNSYTVDDYPIDPSAFKIVHAHIDQYDKCIEIKDYIFFIGIDDANKGKRTIEICNLTRLDLANDIINEIYRKNELFSPVKQLVKGGSDLEEKLNEIRELLNKDLPNDMFKAINDLNTETNAIKITNQLSKIRERGINIEPRSILFFKGFYQSLDAFNTYYNFIDELHKKRVLVSQLMNLPLKDEVIIPITGKLLLNREGLRLLKEALTNHKFFRLQERSKNSLIALLDELAVYNLSAIEVLISRLNEVVLVLESISTIFEDRTIEQLLQGLDQTIVRAASKDAERVLPYARFNSQINIISNLEFYYNEVFIGIDRNRFRRFKRLVENINEKYIK
ncbi:TPA: HNH endonuclease [Bacillus toyonensis]|uniref:HNH endonuclease n=1 Tax=Bacillus toyonensis TaxID=155322 RepID=UPI000BFD3280|nr:HNH endonuclease [Bacillus toyonensis]PHA83176.1 hypothetical protein COE74_24355 [Bacillus toyonensis]QWH48512.1 hypothetical protein EXW64_29995 [Bacillus toyonensis]QWI08763.1 hypothetical protein EXW54_29685 [Bacillus toyonensis]HDR7385655.1 HNH endonuclease [Bacillus toyonensis]